MAKTNADGSKSLGRGDLLAIVIGNVIGGGVMTMTGLAIGITGRSIILSYIICAIMVTIVALPQFFLSATIRMNGGFYTQAAMFGGKWFAGLYSVVFVSYFFGAATYSISFADYVLSAFPEINGKLVAFAILTVFVVLNLTGIQVAAKVQYAMVIILILALLVFAGFGFIHLEPGYFSEEQFFTGVMSAAALLSMATSGTPHFIILTIYVLCSIIILSGMNIGDVANIGNTLANCVQVILCLAIITMPKKIPEIWKRSQFHINDNAYTFLCILGALVSAAFVYYECLEIQVGHIIGIFVYLAIACIYPIIRAKFHTIEINTSYEEA